MIILRGQSRSPVPLSYYERLDCNGFLDKLVLVLRDYTKGPEP
nr:MAG TPA: protein of unknown function (DUF5617) [Caudoviricetes sp.]